MTIVNLKHWSIKNDLMDMFSRKHQLDFPSLDGPDWKKQTVKPISRQQQLTRPIDLVAIERKIQEAEELLQKLHMERDRMIMANRYNGRKRNTPSYYC